MARAQAALSAGRRPPRADLLWQVCGTRRCLAAAAVACAFTKLGVAAGDLGRVNPALRRNGSEAAGRVSGRRHKSQRGHPVYVKLSGWSQLNAMARAVPILGLLCVA